MSSAGPCQVKALLLAGGLGTRLRPLTETTPKCLIDIGGKALLTYWIEALRKAGVVEAVINNHHLPDQVRTYIEQVNEESALRLRESYEPLLLGSAGTIHANRDLADGADCVLVIYADNISDMNLASLVTYHQSHGFPVTMVLFHAPDPRQAGIATLDASGTVVEFVEKPEVPTSDLANAGVYVLSAEAYREVADMDAFDMGFDVLPRFVGRMKGWPWEGYHLDIGTHEALKKAREDVGRVFTPEARLG